MKIPTSLVGAALAALFVILLAGVAFAFWGMNSAWDPFALPPRLPREWRFEREPLSFDFMFRKPEVPPVKIEDMYARQR